MRPEPQQVRYRIAECFPYSLCAPCFVDRLLLCTLLFPTASFIPATCDWLLKAAGTRVPDPTFSLVGKYEPCSQTIWTISCSRGRRFRRKLTPKQSFFHPPTLRVAG